MKNIWIKLRPCFLLGSVGVFSLSLAIPTLFHNIHNPNLIVYFNHDEGYIMDLIWHYFSGEVRESCQGLLDYGLEFLYIADISRILLSPFIHFTPGMFILILRCLHLMGWLLALGVLYFLIRHHFYDFWQAVIGVLLLAVRPAFAYFTHNSKPDPLALFFVILGLYYALKIIDKVSLKNICLTLACASLALLVKISGIFLIPMVIGILLLVQYSYPKWLLRISFLGPFIIGIFLMMMPVMTVLYYQRASTGGTLYQQFGLIKGMLHFKIAVTICTMGVFIIFSTIFLEIMNLKKQLILKQTMCLINKLNATLLMTIGIFGGCILLFGFRWVLAPLHFIIVYSGLGDMFFDSAPTVSLFSPIQNFIIKLQGFDIIIGLVFLFYLITEIAFYPKTLKNNQTLFFKRMALLIFLIPCFILMLLPGRMAEHHVLPFFVVLSILAVQGISLLINSQNIRGIYKNIGCVLFGVIFIFDVGWNGAKVIQSRVYQFHKQEDIVFEISQWVQKNIPFDSSIVSDHPTRVYLPPDYKNVKFLDYADPLKRMRANIDEFQPMYVYYNEGLKDWQLPSLDKIIQDKKIVLMKAFENSSYPYQRYPKSRFVIYKIIY